MGLWPDWEMASLPSVEVLTKTDPLPSVEMENYKMLLDTALELGFQTAPNDIAYVPSSLRFMERQRLGEIVWF